MAKKEEKAETPDAAAAEAPAEGAESAAEGGETEKAGMDIKKIVLFVVLPLLLLGGGGAAAYFMGFLDGLLGIEKEHAEGEDGEHAEDGEEHGDADDHGAPAAAHGGGHGDGHGGAATGFVPIPTMIVNLNSDDGTPRYLRLTVQLELKNPADQPAIEAVIPRVIDQFQTYLRELRVKDLRGSAGIYRLQMELLWRVNQAAAPVEVKDVLFQEILIQ